MADDERIEKKYEKAFSQAGEVNPYFPVNAKIEMAQMIEQGIRTDNNVFPRITTNQDIAVKAGFVAEEVHAESYNLDAILKETHKEEDLLQKKSSEFEKVIEERLITAYKRIRGNVKNGLAIVPVERGASGGSYFSIPPQVQLEIASRKKIIMDEHSGRILVNAELAKEEQEKIQKLIGG